MKRRGPLASRFFRLSPLPLRHRKTPLRTESAVVAHTPSSPTSQTPHPPPFLLSLVDIVDAFQVRFPSLSFHFLAVLTQSPPQMPALIVVSQRLLRLFTSDLALSTGEGWRRGARTRCEGAGDVRVRWRKVR